jgi:putative peptidoglycan lipid II flippase
MTSPFQKKGYSLQKSPNAPKKSPRVSTAKAAFFFGTGTLTSRILGFIRDSLVLAIMPLDMKDAFFAAFKLPNVFRRLFGEGGLSVSFIPVYVGLLEKGEESHSQRLADGIFTLLMSLISLICLMMFLFMDPLVNFLFGGSGFSDIPGKIEMTITMARIMVFFLFFICLFAFFMAVLNANRKFTLTGYAPMLLNVAIICGLWLYKDSEHLVLASAFSVVIGGALQAFLLLPAMVKVHGLPKISFSLSHPSVQVVVRKFMPTLLGVGVLQIMGLINASFASRLMPGAITYIYTADRLLELPLSLIAVSIGTTVLPALSGYWSRKETGNFISSLSRQLSLFYFLAIPCIFGFWFLGSDIVDILFNRGKFSFAEVLIVADILKIYCLTLMAAGSLKIVTQALYATGDTKTPAYIALFGLIVHVIMAPFFMEIWKLNGLVFSTALITLINFVISSFFIGKRVGTMNWRKIASHVSLCAGAACMMGFYLVAINQMQWKQGRFLLDFPLLILIVAGAGLIYFSVGAFLKVEELNIVLRRFKKK